MKKILNLSLTLAFGVLAFTSVHAFDVKYFPNSKTKPSVAHLAVEKGCRYDVVYNEYFKEYSVNYICDSINYNQNTNFINTQTTTFQTPSGITIPVTVNNVNNSINDSYNTYNNQVSYNNSGSSNQWPSWVYSNLFDYSYNYTNWSTPSYSYNDSWSNAFSNLFNWNSGYSYASPIYSLPVYNASYESVYDPYYPTFFSPKEYSYDSGYKAINNSSYDIGYRASNDTSYRVN